MVVFEVKDMSCGHCVRAITEAVAKVDKSAAVRVDLATHRVEVESAASGVDELAEAIKDAGYTPFLATGSATSAGSPRASCCAGR